MIFQRCGYVLKPKYLRDNPKFDPNNWSTWPERNKVGFKFHIQVIGGIQLPNTSSSEKGQTKICDPYVKLRVRYPYYVILQITNKYYLLRNFRDF